MLFCCVFLLAAAFLLAADIVDDDPDDAQRDAPLADLKAVGASPHAVDLAHGVGQGGDGQDIVRHLLDARGGEREAIDEGVIATALAGALIAAYQLDPVATIENGIYALERETIFRVTNVFGVRMAGVFMFSAGTIWLRSGTMPRWMVVLTYTVALVQLFSLGFTLWFTILFPVWVFIVSVHFLVYPPGVADAEDAPAESPAP